MDQAMKVRVLWLVGAVTGCPRGAILGCREGQLLVA